MANTRLITVTPWNSSRNSNSYGIKSSTILPARPTPRRKPLAGPDASNNLRAAPKDL